MNQVCKLLQSALLRKKAARPGYSQRALARDLGVSPAFINGVFRGNKSIPKKWLNEMGRVLELDINERASLVKMVLLGPEISKSLPNLVGTERKYSRSTIELSNRTLLSEWFNIAVLEGLSLSHPHGQLELLSERLGLTNLELDRAITCLQGLGVIEVRDRKIRKREKHLYVPTGRSRKEIRNFHAQMISKARSELLTKTSDEAFHRRLITGFTFALNPSFLERLKSSILNFLDDLSAEAATGDCSEVYQCNIQFFPLTIAGSSSS